MQMQISPTEAIDFSNNVMNAVMKLQESNKHQSNFKLIFKLHFGALHEGITGSFTA